jgi:hypothetical protein
VLRNGLVIPPWNAGWGSTGRVISPVHFTLYVNEMSTPSYHIKLALYADDTTIIATSSKPTLLVSHLEAQLSNLQRWLTEWRIAIKYFKSTAIIFAQAVRRSIQTQPVNLFGSHSNWPKQLVFWGLP